MALPHCRRTRFLLKQIQESTELVRPQLVSRAQGHSKERRTQETTQRETRIRSPHVLMTSKTQQRATLLRRATVSAAQDALVLLKGRALLHRVFCAWREPTWRSRKSYQKYTSRVLYLVGTRHWRASILRAAFDIWVQKGIGSTTVSAPSLFKPPPPPPPPRLAPLPPPPGLERPPWVRRWGDRAA